MFKHCYWLIYVFVLQASQVLAQEGEDMALAQRVERLEHRVEYLVELLDQTNVSELEEKVVQIQRALASKSMQVKESDFGKPNSSKQDKAFLDIEKMLAKQDYKRAQIALKRYTEQFSSSKNYYKAMFELANLMVVQGDLLNAEPLFVKISQQRKELKAPDAMLRLMTIYWQTGRHEQAEKAYQSLVDRYPRSPVAQLARVQYKQWINAERN